VNKLRAIWLFFLPHLLIAQADYVPPSDITKFSNRAYIGISGGPSFPFGAFENSELAIEEGGYAQTGYSINLDYAYRFYKNLIVAGQYTRVNNQLDEEALRKSGRLICSTCNPLPTFGEVNTTAYELNAFFAGIGVIKEQSNLSFQMQFMIGYANMFSPQVELKGPNDLLTVQSNEGSNLAYGVATGLRIHLTDQLDLSTIGNFILFQADFDQVVEFNGIKEIKTTAQRYQVFNLSFGLGYRFIKKEDEPEYQLKY